MDDCGFFRTIKIIKKNSKHTKNACKGEKVKCVLLSYWPAQQASRAPRLTWEAPDRFLQSLRLKSPWQGFKDEHGAALILFLHDIFYCCSLSLCALELPVFSQCRNKGEKKYVQTKKSNFHILKTH